MKYFALIFALISSQAFSEDRAFDLNFHLNFYNDMRLGIDTNDSTKRDFTPIDFGMGTRFAISADLSDEAEFNLELNPTANPKRYQHCAGLDYVNEASLNYTVNEYFSFGFGCLRQQRAGFEAIESSDLSFYNTDGLNLIYDNMAQGRFTPAFNLNVDFFGTLTVQVLKNDLMAGEIREASNIPALNFAWTMSILGIEPLVQVGIYDKKFKSLHFAVGLKVEFDQMTLRGGYFQDKSSKGESGQKDISIASWNVFAAYENSSLFRPFLRVHNIEYKEVGKSIDDKLTFSLGNRMELSDDVEPYVTINLIKNKQNDYIPDIRLGINAEL